MAGKEESLSESKPNILLKHKPLQRSSCSKCGDCIVILCLMTVSGLLQLLKPNHQYIPVYTEQANDEQINFNFAYPIVPEIIPGKSLALILFLPWSGLIIFDIILLKIMLQQLCWNEVRQNIFLMIRMHYFCVWTAFICTELIKLMVGYPRPTFLAEQLKYDEDSWAIKNSRMSFISGHASITMSLLCLMSIMFYKSWQYSKSQDFLIVHNAISKTSNPHSYYLCDLWHKLKNIPLLASLFVWLPVFIAMYIACTRIIDYQHSAVDVFGGMIIGASCSYISYLVFYNETYWIFQWKVRMIKKEEQYVFAS